MNRDKPALLRSVLASFLLAAMVTFQLGCERVAAKGDEPEDSTSASAVLPCPIDQKNDGKFTGWPDTTDCQEWDVEPIKGTYGNLYIRYDADGTLRLLNDWHLCKEQPPANFYNLFQITTGGGTQHWMTRVASNKVHVWLNGKKLGAFSRGAAGFGPSPTLQQGHTIYEFALPDVKPGSIAMKLGDPGGPPFTTPEEAIVMDPKGYTGVLQQGGGAQLTGDEGPMVVAVQPAITHKPEDITLIGYDFGDAAGTVNIAGKSVSIVSWSAQKVVVKPPQLADGNHPIALATAASKNANIVALQVQCQPKCGGKSCGNDGCGGTCGTCPNGTQCQGGSCQCVPACVNKSCGDDGCGGTCGNCKVTDQCVFGKCECAPQCSGKQCGDDGCGGSCGGCQGALATCVDGQCACTGDCTDKDCGNDGCQGSCGSCDSGLTCSQNKCVAN